MFGKNAGNFQYSVRPCQHWGDWKRGNGKRTNSAKSKVLLKLLVANFKKQFVTVESYKW